MAGTHLPARSGDGHYDWWPVGAFGSMCFSLLPVHDVIESQMAQQAPLACHAFRLGFQLASRKVVGRS